jgi:hypothetical protein
MTIDQGGEQSAVYKSGDGDVIRLRLKVTDRLVSLPVALDVVAVFVQTSAAIAMREGVGIVILEGFFRHGVLLSDGNFSIIESQ